MTFSAFRAVWARMTPDERFEHIATATAGGDRWRREHPSETAEHQRRGGVGAIKWWKSLAPERQKAHIERAVIGKLRSDARCRGFPEPVVFVEAAPDRWTAFEDDTGHEPEASQRAT
jgi:hypothetical protein